MEGRLRKYGGQASPEMPRKQHHHHHQQPRKIPVVYYLCRNRHLEHPHFIEVPLSSPEGLHLRDVTKRLVELRGKGMPSMYSWSCKRSYKNGFVWHDLSEDDLILPAHGNEYVLKGSELLDQSPPARVHNGNASGTSLKLVNQKSPQTTETTQEASSSSSPVTVIKESKTTQPLPTNQEDEHSPRRQPSWDSGSPGPSEFRVYKPAGAADASTQTDDAGRRKAREKGQGQGQGTCARGVSTEDGPVDYEFEEGPRRNQAPVVEEISPVQTSSSTSSLGGKMETLESLIRADARKMNSFRILEGEEVYLPTGTGTRLRATNVLMQLITCGSLSVKDHNRFGIVPTYKSYSHVKYPSPMFAGSMVLGELDCLSENPRLMGLRMEEKEYYSGSLIETKKHKEETGEGVPTLKRSSSYNADRSCKSPDSKHEKEKAIDSSRSKCLPRTMKISSSNKQHRNRMMRSPVSDCPRNSSAGPDSGHSSQGGSKRFTDASSVKGSSTRLESFKEEKEKVIKIEERLTSGARVIIQSRAPCEESDDSSSS